MATYDDSNIFARVLRGELPCEKLYEDEHILAFKDIAPQAPVHALVIPKGKYVSPDDFAEQASDAEAVAMMRAVGHVARALGLHKTGYRLIANHGPHSHQAVAHLHWHVLGGGDLGRGLIFADDAGWTD
ncbi:MAG: HIT domain-containing protein [Alphaproteobacteria bacterium]